MKVMVTGAAGFIGGKHCIKISRCKVTKYLVIDREMYQARLLLNYLTLGGILEILLRAWTRVYQNDFAPKPSYIVPVLV
jgi:nucleoside-diphosphate-sugar epimerase